jgi:hypothetical protein
MKMMKQRTRRSILLPIAALVLAACGSAETPPTPTLAPTATPVPPTATPLPPTATVVPTSEGTGEDASAGESAGNASSDLLSALQTAEAATSYRLEMHMSAKGALGLSADANESMSLFTLTGEFSGKDARYTMKGMLSGMLGVDPNKGLEVITVGDKSYLHGPVNMLGAKEDKWYVLESDQSNAIKPPLQAEQFLGELTKNDVDVNTFKQTGTDTIDGQACTVFSGDQTATLKAFGATGAGAITGAGAEALEQIKNAQMSFAVCEDGFPHRMQLMLEATNKDKPDQTFTFNIDMHMYDFNTPVSITAPADAEPLTIPQQ